MKLIKAVIRPFKLEEVKDALIEIGVKWMTVIEAKNFGGYHVSVNFVPKIIIEVIVPDELLSSTVKVISRTAKTGKSGDGKILILPLEDVIRIRTEERGDQALF